ncbi:MAG: cupin domain-containing protein [Pirellulaceae bacterium]|nr:cupin domain-containing protein [Pirellulaceae bacterium]
MAVVRIPDENRELTDPREIAEFLRPFGIWYEKWEVESRVGSDPTDQQILEAYAPEIERLKASGGFVTADVINVSPATPGLDAMVAKFAKEHTHSEDEVRFTIKGRGVFHVHPEQGPVFGIEVESGDLINVPRHTRHWFHLCDDRTIRCIRLFEDPAGWTPHYVEQPISDQYLPVCLGPSFVPPASDAQRDQVVKP